MNNSVTEVTELTKSEEGGKIMEVDEEPQNDFDGFSGCASPKTLCSST